MQQSRSDLTSQFFALADCYGAPDRLKALRLSAAALALNEKTGAAEDGDMAPWLSSAPPMPIHARMAARRGVGALYGALRGLRAAWLQAALRRWAVNVARASMTIVLPQTADAARLSIENTALTSELSMLEAAHAQQEAVLRRASDFEGHLDRRVSELYPGLVVPVQDDDSARSEPAPSPDDGDAYAERIELLEHAVLSPVVDVQKRGSGSERQRRLLLNTVAGRDEQSERDGHATSSRPSSSTTPKTPRGQSL